MTAYMDGSPWTLTQGRTYTNAKTFAYTNGFPGILVSTNNAGIGYNYIAVGVNSHSGTPDPDDGDDLPNNGQLQGGLADIRIYNRALSAAEVGAIYAGGTTGGGSSGGTTNSGSIRATTFRSTNTYLKR
jgi:hypothetical protein